MNAQPGVFRPGITLSIVIVSWNTRALLAACLDSVAAEAAAVPGGVETLVVDNASTDGSAEMVEQRFPWARLLRSDRNLGFAGANNVALAQCRGELVLLLNPDTKLLPGALAELVRFMAAHPDAGAAGARILNADGSLQESCYPQPGLLRELWRLLHLDRLRPWAAYAMDAWPTDRPRQVDDVLGAALLVRRTVLEQIGLLDTGFFMYSEEIDLCRRVRDAGRRIYWAPDAQVIHYGGQSTQQVATKMFLQLYASKVRYFRKHDGWAAAQAYKGVLLLAALLRLAAAPLAWFQGAAQRHRKHALAGQYFRLVTSLHKM